MPIYEFRCSDESCGDISEKILSMKEYNSEQVCERESCGKKSERIYHDTRVERYYQRMAQNPNPVVIHRDKQGNVRYPAHADAPIPLGFEKVEMHTLGEIHKFEKEQNLDMREEHERFAEGEYAHNESLRKERHANLRSLMPGMNSYGKDFARAAMEHSMKTGPRNTDPGFHVEIAHYDQRERGEYRDEQTGWKGKKW